MSEVDDDESLVAAHVVAFNLGQEFLDSHNLFTISWVVLSHGWTPSQQGSHAFNKDLHKACDRFLLGIYVDREGVIPYMFSDFA